MMSECMIEWVGNDGFLLSDQSTTILTDPDLFHSERIWSPSKETKSRCLQADFVCYTHAHEDHFSTQTAVWLLHNSRCRFIIPESCREKANSIPDLAERAVFVTPGHSGSLHTISYQTIRAIHGHKHGTVYSGADVNDCGYVFTLNGKRFYQPGDTLLLEEHTEMHPVDGLFLSPTEHNTYIDGSILLIEWLHPTHIICQHFGTYEEPPVNYFWAHGYVEELKAALPQSVQERLIVPKPEEKIIL